MRNRMVKFQFSVFGTFPFSPTPEIMMELMRAFLPDGLMPSLSQGFDMAKGVSTNRISLAKGDAFQIFFANDRIDIIENFPASDISAADFVKKSEDILNKIPNIKDFKFIRIALVTEFARQDISAAEMEGYVNKYLTAAKPGAIEWSARWIEMTDSESETYTTIFDVMRLQGIMLVSGKPEAFDGIKYMSDMATRADNIVPRYSISDIGKIAEQLLKLNAAADAIYG